MFIELRPGESVRFGKNATLTVLNVGDAGVQIALEGTDCVPGHHNQIERLPCRLDMPPFVADYIPPWLI